MRFLTFQKLIATGTAIAAASAAVADIDYHVSLVAHDDARALHVEITLPTKPGPVSMQSPRWAPGAYVYSDAGKSVSGFAVTDAKGSPLPFSHPDFSTWTVTSPGGPIKLNYEVPIGVFNDVVHYGGPRTYLYAVGRTQEKTRLKVDLPDGWKLRCGLDPVGDSVDRFTAPTYDVLADTPVTMGHFTEDTYISHGKPHYIVIYGAATAQVNRELLKKTCQFTSDAEGNFFGEVPYKRYVWHFSVNSRPDGGGGLEHLNGTEIGVASGVGTLAQSVLTHEFFHLWNVKRIRSKVLGPFDYTKLPKTGALWWLEGVTDYYAIMIPSRYGWWGSDQLEKFVARNIGEVETGDGRLKISPYDSSYRVNEAANGRGNSNGLYVSYYSTGWVLGLMLDEEIRIHSHGKHSLDDVELALWKECRNNQPGFPEDEIRKQCVRFGGPELGDLYDKWVMQPGILPVEDELAKMGLKYALVDTEIPMLPIRFSASSDLKGVGLFEPAAGHQSEVITAINGESLAGNNEARIMARATSLIRQLKIGDTATLTVTVIDSHGTQTTETREMKVLSTTRKSGVVTEMPDATPEQLALRVAWMSPRPGTKAVFSVPAAPTNPSP